MRSWKVFARRRMEYLVGRYRDSAGSRRVRPANSQTFQSWKCQEAAAAFAASSRPLSRLAARICTSLPEIIASLIGDCCLPTDSESLESHRATNCNGHPQQARIIFGHSVRQERKFQRYTNVSLYFFFFFTTMLVCF